MGSSGSFLSKYFEKESLLSLLRKGVFRVLSVGPTPNHIAFILDGNRRFAQSLNLKEGDGHKIGFLTLMSMLKYCYEMGVKYVTIYAFSIDNFKRKPHEVQNLMDLMLEKIDESLEKESIVNNFGIRVHFIGNLMLLNEQVRAAAKKAMAATAKNDKAVLSICVAYTSTDEIVHAIQESYYEKQEETNEQNSNDIGVHNGFVEKNPNDIKVTDIERHMYSAFAPNPDVLIRTSGETRLSNFLLWQTTHCHLYSPSVLWPNISFWHLVWGILNYQKVHSYLEKKRKKTF
ncbi:hypothetical protein Syun_003546 [Stephania yunnanensis]|uniref:Alkyl transferase n=1 Tax=Stephania yunnanensis TaxID=152371 RepID=A0AAP0L5A4_9MAGN